MLLAQVTHVDNLRVRTLSPQEWPQVAHKDALILLTGFFALRIGVRNLSRQVRNIKHTPAQVRVGFLIIMVHIFSHVARPKLGLPVTPVTCTRIRIHADIELFVEFNGSFVRLEIFLQVLNGAQLLESFSSWHSGVAV